MNNDVNKNCTTNKYNQNKIWAWFFGGVSLLCAGTTAVVSMRYFDYHTTQTTSEEYYRQHSLNNCRRSLYGLSDGLKNADANIGKIMLSTTSEYLSKLLTETASIAESAVTDLSYLPLQEQTATLGAKYFNQLGDYCKSLAKGVTEKGELTQRQKDDLNDLRKVGKKLKKAIDKACLDEEAFTLETDGVDYIFELELKDVDEETFDYPQLVYDGPFSDSVTEQTIERKVLSVQQVEQKIFKTFKECDVTEVKFVSKAKTKSTVYYFDVVLGGQSFCVTTATDGTIAQLDVNQSTQQGTETQNYSKQDLQRICCQKAQSMAKTLGFDVCAMWTSQPIENRIYVNMIAKEGDVKFYSDMVKMAIDAQTLQVVGVDAFAYIANHKQRSLPQSYLSKEQARSTLSKDLTVMETALCVVPIDDEEAFCYEFKVKVFEEEFLIYVDALSGKEVEILKILDDDMGYTVM